jgi:hypothetical protein
LATELSNFEDLRVKRELPLAKKLCLTSRKETYVMFYNGEAECYFVLGNPREHLSIVL